MVVATSAAAQMTATPVLQNAFVNPGFTLGVNFGGGDGARAYGGAVAWAPANERAQFSGGLAWVDPDNGTGAVTWGLRAMIPVLAPTRPWNVGIFGGIGGLSTGGRSTWRLPFGASFGYRRALGASRGISGYVAPFYCWSRLRQQGATTTHGDVRIGFGVDAAVLTGVGITLGYETGATADAGEPGPTGGIFGIGISYALHRAQ